MEAMSRTSSTAKSLKEIVAGLESLINLAGRPEEMSRQSKSVSAWSVGKHVEHLTLSDEAADWLATEGYDPSFGARPLKRLLQKAVADPLALQLLDGSFQDGDAIKVVVKGDNLEFVAG